MVDRKDSSAQTGEGVQGKKEQTIMNYVKTFEDELIATVDRGKVLEVWVREKYREPADGKVMAVEKPKRKSDGKVLKVHVDLNAEQEAEAGPVRARWCALQSAGHALSPGTLPWPETLRVLTKSQQLRRNPVQQRLRKTIKRIELQCAA